MPKPKKVTIVKAVQNDEKEPTVRRAKQISMLEHAKKKSMWAGSKNSQTIESYVLTTTEEGKVFQLEGLKYPPVLLKIIDEVIVNAIDHHTHYPKLVTEIKIAVTDLGEIEVYNNGPGIPVEKTQNINGVEMYLPQLIASEFLAGDNLDDDGSNTKGGTNGIGLKLASAFSKHLVLETVDATTSLHYKQIFKDGLTIVEVPEVKPSAKSVKPYTRITFLPDYTEFKLDNKKFQPTLAKLLETRAWQAAAYTSAKVSYNNTLVPVNSFEDFCQMFTENLVMPSKLTKSEKSSDYPWEICLSVSDGKERQMSIINGVFIPKGGTHIQHIQNLLVANLRDRVEKEIKKSGVKFNKNYITNNVFIFMKGPVPSPEFLSQTKEAISDPIEKFANYEFPARDWGKIWELLEPAIMATFLKKQLGDTKTRANRGKVDVPKYKEAKFCRDAKKCHQCGLIVTEGDSASGTADIGLHSKASPNFNYDWFGVYSIGGVPVNGLKESLELKTKKTKDDSHIVHTTPKPRGRRAAQTDAAVDLETKSTKTAKKSPVRKPKQKISKDDLDLPPRRTPNMKIQKNERIDSLKKVLGLDYNKTYTQTEIGDKEFKTLRYGFIVGLTDQDLDGFNIFGLLATYFMTYWPALVQRGFLRRINTPVIRAYPKNSKKDKVKEFYSEREAREWLLSVGEDTVKNKYKIKYYKGLGSHKQAFKEVTQIFKNIGQKIRTYTLDAKSFETMYIYYGNDTAPRKVHLADPHIEEASDALSLPITQHFKIDTKLYQRDNIIRKLLAVPDGFVDSRRKVFFTARKNGRNEIKVQGLAGKVVADANYHHGEASLEQTIVRMAQGYPMARNLPLLLPLGQFGTRAKGYKDYAASRYIFTMVNHRLTDKLFRKEDDYILYYELDDGERYEPKYYVPIIPYVLCEDNELPATGWKISVYARDIRAIFKNTREMIMGKINKCKKLPPWLRGFKGTLKTYKNRTYTVGVYEYLEAENALHITELPVGVFSNSYLKGSDDDKIKKKVEDKKGIQILEWIDDIDDNTAMDGVDIMLYLKTGAYDALTADDSKYGNEVFDAFEDYFQLKEPIHHHINLVNEKHEVVEYKTYEDVFNDWFEFRKKLYAVRVERELILNDLEVKMLRNMQRFSKNHDNYGITNKTSEEAANAILKKEKYEIFNHTVLENPKYTSIEVLRDTIMLEEYGASYDYILRMSYRDLTENAYNKREARIQELLERKQYLIDDDGLFVGAKIWLVELDELEKSIQDGLTSEWFYGENEYTFDD